MSTTEVRGTLLNLASQTALEQSYHTIFALERSLRLQIRNGVIHTYQSSVACQNDNHSCILQVWVNFSQVRGKDFQHFGYALVSQLTSFEKWRQVANLGREQDQLFCACSPFSRALRQLHVFALYFDWLFAF